MHTLKCVLIIMAKPKVEKSQTLFESIFEDRSSKSQLQECDIPDSFKKQIAKAIVGKGKNDSLVVIITLKNGKSATFALTFNQQRLCSVGDRLKASSLKAYKTSNDVLVLEGEVL